jgi:hypothetical protein
MPSHCLEALKHEYESDVFEYEKEIQTRTSDNRNLTLSLEREWK